MCIYLQNGKMQIYIIYYNYTKLKTTFVDIIFHTCGPDKFQCCVGPICLFYYLFMSLLCSSSRLCCVESSHDSPVMNWKIFGSKWLQLNSRHYSSVRLEALRKFTTSGKTNIKVLTTPSRSFVRIKTCYAVLSQFQAHFTISQCPPLESKAPESLQN